MTAVPALFQWSLVLASTVPFALLTWFAVLDEGRSAPFGLELAIAAIAFLNRVHVPATFYLYSDEMVRQQALAAPIRCIAVPLLIMATFGSGYLAAAVTGGAVGDYSVLCILLVFLAWQMWHFGMQSYGVVAFLSMSSGRPARTGQRNRLERYLIIGGAVSGMMSFYHTLHPQDRLRTLPSVDYTVVDSAGAVVYGIGMAVCIGCTAAAVLYLIRRRREFTMSSAVVFLVSVCFFLPDYLAGVLPNATPPNAMVSYLNFSLVHGIQYLVFIAFHAIGTSRRAAITAATERYGDLRAVAAALPPLVLCLFLVLLVGGVLTTSVITGAFVGYVVDYFATVPAGQIATSAAVAFALGMTAAHFWIDQSLWKLSRPGQREWVRSRFSIVLAQPSPRRPGFGRAAGLD